MFLLHTCLNFLLLVVPVDVGTLTDMYTNGHYFLSVNKGVVSMNPIALLILLMVLEQLVLLVHGLRRI